MADIVIIGGPTLHVDPDSITAVAGPSVTAPELHVEVFGAAPHPVSTLEGPDSIMAKLDLDRPFAKLTRPDGSPIWIRGKSVNRVRVPLAEETLGRPAGAVQSVVFFGGDRQLLREDVATLRPILIAAGAKVFS